MAKKSSKVARGAVGSKQAQKKGASRKKANSTKANPKQANPKQASSKKANSKKASTKKVGVKKASTSKAAPKRAKPLGTRSKAATSARASTSTSTKPAKRGASKQVSKAPAKRRATQGAASKASAARERGRRSGAGPVLEVETTHTLERGSDVSQVDDGLFEGDDAEGSQTDFGALATEETRGGITPQDMLSVASPAQAATVRRLRENDPTYAAGPVDARTFAIHAARLLHDDNCTDVVVLDVKALGQVCDYIVIGSGTSDRQMRGVSKNVSHLGEQQGYRVYRTHADERATWILADFVDIVVHLFEPHARATYDLEMMWTDAPRVAWEREDQVVRNRAGVV